MTTSLVPIRDAGLRATGVQAARGIWWLRRAQAEAGRRMGLPASLPPILTFSSSLSLCLSFCCLACFLF